ncbi:MAG TPA: class I SAM-dependent methyltransferase [Acidobacteriota bacterium]
MEPAEQAGLRRWRRELLAGLRGAVLEIGAGTGANLALYPDAVDRLVLCEPSAPMRAKLASRVAQRPRRDVRIVAAPVEALAAGGAGFDAVVATLVLCSVPDQRRALAAINRMLRPGGRFVFMEHVAAEPSSNLYRWQRWIEPLWKRLPGSCHLTRRTESAIAASGLSIEHIRREPIAKTLPLTRVSIRGVAVKRSCESQRPPGIRS